MTATSTMLSLGGDVTLTCNIDRGIPATNTYIWTHVNSSFILTAETSPILRLSSITLDQFGSYRCEVRNIEGVARDTITIELTCESQLIIIMWQSQVENEHYSTESGLI